MFLKIPSGGGWDFGKNVAYHLVEIDNEGFVKRVIDVNFEGEVIPSKNDAYDATDHPPFAMTCDWGEFAIGEEEFERYWSKRNSAI